MNQPGDTWGSTASNPSDSFARDERLRREVQAALAAYDELGPRYEKELVDSVADRLQPVIDARIARRIVQEPVQPARWPGMLARGAAGLAAAILFAVPLFGLATVRRADQFEYHEHYMHMVTMPARHIFEPSQQNPSTGAVAGNQPAAPGPAQPPTH